MPWKSRGFVSLGAVLGTFLSLGFFLKAVQTGHLASVSGVAITGTLFSSAFECLWERKWPTKTLWVALGLFLLGSYLVLG
jgi:drug/metabolite transporter (DMT)-like permease